ncbi:hypothetical protein SPAN111604_13060 [Sphingomonas antarctica]
MLAQERGQAGDAELADRRIAQQQQVVADQLGTEFDGYRLIVGMERPALAAVDRAGGEQIEARQFDGRSERDRMCDWLRWQKPLFREYLAYAAANGDHALEKRLVDEMFETEARLKKEGRVAGGLRPLRMWRGE